MVVVLIVTFLSLVFVIAVARVLTVSVATARVILGGGIIREKCDLVGFNHGHVDMQRWGGGRLSGDSEQAVIIPRRGRPPWPQDLLAV
jgi:hypothetical protein